MTPLVKQAPLLVVGHYAHDTLVGNDGSVARALGGSVAYVAAIWEALGAPYAVVGKAGRDFRYANALTRPPVLAPGARTTHCVDDYSSGSRVETLSAVCAPIRAAELPESAEVALACGIAREIPPAALRALRRRARVLIADAQGLLRRIGPGGRVENEPLERTEFHAVAGSLDILKAGENEARCLDLAALRRRLTVIVTLGARGCRILAPDGDLELPGFPAPELDPTGAGDCFTAGLGYGLWKGWELAQAARFGNWCGALAVRQVGVPKLTAADFAVPGTKS